jgi:hypothetical protein
MLNHNPDNPDNPDYLDLQPTLDPGGVFFPAQAGAL